MRNKFLKYIPHILFCFGFLVFSYLFTPGGTLSFSDLYHNNLARISLLGYITMVAFFYINYYYLVPKLYLKKQYLFYFGFILVCVLLINYVPNLFAGTRPSPRFDHNDRQENQSSKPKSFSNDHLQGPEPFPDNEPPEPAPFSNNASLRPAPFSNFEKSHAVFLFLIGIFGSLFLKSHNRLLVTEKEKLNAELSFLKAQINPHFLFNTLNSIYSLAINKDERTAGTIVQLSELMRYIIRDANDNFVLLEKELNYINNYIALQKSRLGDTAIINYQVNGSSNSKKIAPLILISFIENAFKHGINPDENSQIDISLNIKETNLQLLVSNKKVTKAANYSEEGVGIKNTQKRLDLVYPGNHTLIMHNNADRYAIDLSINLL